MDYIYETIKFNGDLPIKIFVHQVSYVQNHWHECLELLFVLSGKVKIVMGNTTYELKEEDLIIINSNEIHSTSSTEDNMILVLQLPLEMIKSNCKERGSIKFDCKSFLYKNDHQRNFDKIRRTLAQMMWINNKGEKGYELKLQSLLFDLIYTLYSNFSRIEDNVESLSSEKYMERLARVIKYIKENYTLDISLNNLAKQEYLSISYLSKFFKKYIGTTFLEYLNNIRLENAVKELIYTDNPISQIVINHGFPNEASFLNIFKEVYGEIPSKYRKKVKSNLLLGDKKSTGPINYLLPATKDVFSHLFKYLHNSADNILDKQENINSKLISLELGKRPKKIYHNWKNLITIGKAKDGLIAEVQKQLKMVQDEIGFKYIRFHGIFDDEMMVYDEDKEGNPLLNFGYIDELFRFFNSINLKPFIELGFMPHKLARNDKGTFYRKSIISMPKDMNKWNYLIRSFMVHCYAQFGRKEVDSWYFEFWNEPDLKGMFWHDSDKDYFEFYKNTYTTIKEFSKNIKLGGPSTILSYDTGIQFTNNFLSLARTENCLPDFVSFHIYPSINEDNSTDLHLSKISSYENYLYDKLELINTLAQKYQYNSSQLHMTEWNSNTDHRDLANDTTYKSAYIVKNLVENMDSIGSFGYWTLTDFIEELRVPSHTFHGGLGVITNNGIKKPGYYAFWLLNKLGGMVIEEGDGYYLTKGDKGYQLLVYNYCHFDKLYCMKDTSSISLTERYNVFINNNSKELKFVINGFTKDFYEVKEYNVNRINGSSFDNWLSMGSPEYMNYEELYYLKNGSLPFYKRKLVEINEDYILNTILSPHEIQLYEINFCVTNKY